MSYIHDTCATYVVVHATGAGSFDVDVSDAWAGSFDVDACAGCFDVDACVGVIVIEAGFIVGVVSVASSGVLLNCVSAFYYVFIAGPGAFVNCCWWKNCSSLNPK